uniref:Uncharacterized protein n=1 Tax=Rhizophagus irregularis (strain DAOM 181602 / DAOM 197198 / MUCL 43194) TaxID=747089 RepID=U9T7S8_RHIID
MQCLEKKIMVKVKIKLRKALLQEVCNKHKTLMRNSEFPVGNLFNWTFGHPIGYSIGHTVCPIVQLFFILYDLNNMDIVQLDLDICPIVQLDAQYPIKSIGHCPNPRLFILNR